MATKTRVVIVGGGAGGLTVASRQRQPAGGRGAAGVPRSSGVYDFRDDLEHERGRLVIVNVDGETAPERIRAAALVREAILPTVPAALFEPRR